MQFDGIVMVFELVVVKLIFVSFLGYNNGIRKTESFGIMGECLTLIKYDSNMLIVSGSAGIKDLETLKQKICKTQWWQILCHKLAG